MPYITKEVREAMKKAVKAAVPEFKLGIKTDYNSITVAILSGPLEAKDTYEQINTYWVDRNCTPEWAQVVNKILAAMDSVCKKVTEYEDGDYGNIPNYYRHVHIGRWNKRYEQKVA